MIPRWHAVTSTGRYASADVYLADLGVYQTSGVACSEGE